MTATAEPPTTDTGPLMAEIARVRALIEGREDASETTAPPTLTTLQEAFGLSDFERDVLLLCAAPELEGSLDVRPTFALALALLPGAHWSALAPSAPLRRWHLVQPLPDELLTRARLRIDETVLHFLAGVGDVDPYLAGVVDPVATPHELAASHAELAQRLARSWSAAGAARAPLVHLTGRDATSCRAIAAAAAATCGIALCVLPAAALPGEATDRTALARRWERQARLSGAALLVECDDFDTPEAARRALAFAERLDVPVAVTGREHPGSSRPVLGLEVVTPTATEQRALWQRVLPQLELDGEVVEQFDLGAEEIRAAALDVATQATPTAEALWDACRARTRPRLDDLAQRIEPAGDLEDLVLPAPQKATLRDLILHVRHRTAVNDRWGFAAKSSRGNGVSALFAGPTGTGKTMAAEVLAGELRLDLYRIDLSAVVSKYIGETEKNLRRVFDAADQGGAILLFDEADALFGRRTEVRDSHDRYANIEVGYLLQRMEAYRGLAILTTNLKGALDPAFLRRIRFVVQFPRPDEPARRAIWERIFPDVAPLAELDFAALARLDVTGGAIRNIAVRAAVLAAAAGSPVAMTQLAAAARAECAKLDLPPAEALLARWAA